MTSKSSLGATEESRKSLTSLLKELRRGEQAAAAEIQARFGGHIRRLARAWLSGRKLNRLLDSEDICQSVMSDFFNRYSQGSYELGNEKQLRALLARIATSRLLYHWQRHRAAKRDMHRLAEPGGSDDRLENLAVSSQASPSQILAVQELADQCRRCFSPMEWQVVELRNEGESWDDIAAIMQKSPDALRMQYTRAVTRVARQFYEEDSP